MQDPSIYSQIKTQVQQPQQQTQLPEQEHLKCPRCDSPNTKFCYYNNYNLSQPRHFCKNCRRYWTKGGTLRNIPVGGSSRKSAKRSSASDDTGASASSSKRAATAPAPDNNDNVSKSNEGEVTDKIFLKEDNFEGQFGNFMEPGVSFSSLLSSTEVQFGNYIDGSSDLQMGGHFGDRSSSQDMDRQVLESGSRNNADEFLSIPGGDGGGGGGWGGGGNGWPDLSMYTPGSSFI